MKLDVTCMRYLTKDDYRVLTAVEMGMKNHEVVPVPLITSIAKLRHGGSYKILSTLLRYKLVAHTNNEYDGYRLSFLGFDILALRSFVSRGVITSVGNQIGVGKESDIFEAQDEDGNEVVIKIHRLGRTSFRAVRKNRDYLKGKSKAGWLYMSRLAAVKEFAFMKALYSRGFPTPIPYDQNRHVVVMSKVSGSPMSQVKAGKLQGPEEIFKICLAILKRLAEHGLVHCDFNEFNLMVDDKGNVTLIDFPQMVSTSHPNASELFLRDINCLIKFFAMKMRYIPPDEVLFRLEDVMVESESTVSVSKEVMESSGLNEGENDLLMQYMGDEMNEDDVEDGAEVEEGEDDVEVGVKGDTSVEEETENVLPSTIFSDKLATSLEKSSEGISEDENVDESDENTSDNDTENIDEKDNSVRIKTKRVICPIQKQLEIDSDVRDKIRRDINRRGKGRGKSGSGGTRNATKKRNKYGRIVKDSI